jgi:MFS family permease
MTAFAPLRHRQFRLFACARLVSVLGNSIAPVALAFAVLDLTGSALDLGQVLAARTVALLLFLLFGGAVADRLPKKLVLVSAGVLAAVTQCVVAGLLLAGHPPVWSLAALEAVNGAATAFLMPALQGLLPQLVPGDLLRQSNALFSLSNNGARIVGVSIAGVLVAAVGSGWTIAIDAVTFAAAAVMFTRLRVPATERLGRGTLATDLRAGWEEFTSHRWLWTVVLGASVMNMAYAGAWGTLGPVVADNQFGRSWWGLILAMTTTGMLVGAAVMMRVSPSRPLLTGVIALFGYAPLIALLAVEPRPLPLMIAAFVAGVGMGVFGVVWQTAIQENVPAAALSRVSSYDLLGSYAALPAGQVLAGYLAIQFEVTNVILAAAALCVAATLAMAAVPGVRGLRAEAR